MNADTPSTFDVDSQSAQTIGNVGGDHNVYVDGTQASKARTVARAIKVFAGR